MGATANAINMYILPTKIVSTWIILGLVCIIAYTSVDSVLHVATLAHKPRQIALINPSNDHIEVKASAPCSIAFGHDAIAVGYGIAIGCNATATSEQ